MSNLLGQPFKPWVTEQIDIRQKSLGKYTNIPDKDLQYYITKAPWIRLASSVNLNKSEVEGNSVLQKLISNGLTENQVGGDNLAKNLILQGGALSTTIGKNGEIISNGLNSGLNNGSSIFNGAYGWGGIEERGYVPMPGITNADVQYLNNGALTKTTINIRCFSKRQFQLIDVLYLRPGYTLLLEFGHSVYLDNDGKLKSFDKFSTTPLRTLLNPKGKTQYDIYREIETEKFNYKGNYDAVYGKISNFNWQFNPDGSYDCQVILTGMGDVIESLKMNVSLNTQPINISTEETKTNTTPSDSNPVVANKDKTLLNVVLYELYQKFSTRNGILTTSIKLSDYPDPHNNFKLKDLKIKNSLLSIPNSIDNEGIDSTQTYMTFGTLMAIVQSRLLLYSGDEEKRTPIVTIDMDFDNLDKDENFILKFPGGFSSNPRVCVVPYTNTSPPIPNLNIPTSRINTILTLFSSWNVDGSLYLGRLAAIYVNINYIAKVLGELEPNEENQVSILDFLQTLIKGITQSLGGFNKITVQSTIDGKIKFIEEIPQRFNKDAKEEFARFNVFGVKQNEGSFIKNINLTAELSNDFATMISIGAQSNGNQLSGNATSFSNYNAGLEDRIIPEKFSYQPPNPKDGDEKNKVNIESNWGRLSGGQVDETSEDIKIKKNKNLFTDIYNENRFISENINSLTSFNTTHASLILGKLTQPGGDGKQQLQAPFFLPFNFSLEMEGLSGMILYQKFLISDDVLPPSYEGGGVEIQIKGINHSINTTAWTTKLDTLSTPAAKNSLGEETTPYPLNTETIKPTSCGERFGDEQYDATAGGLYPNLNSLTSSRTDPREGLTFRGIDMRVYSKLIEDSSGKKLPPAGYGVSRKLCEALVVIGEAIDEQVPNLPTEFSSGYRSPVYNCSEGGAVKSMHKTGGAADIRTGAGQDDNIESSLPLVLYKIILQLIIDGKIPEGGVGLYNTFVHYDIRGYNDPSKKARWDFRNK